MHLLPVSIQSVPIGEHGQTHDALIEMLLVMHLEIVLLAEALPAHVAVQPELAVGEGAARRITVSREYVLHVEIVGILGGVVVVDVIVDLLADSVID